MKFYHFWPHRAKDVLTKPGKSTIGISMEKTLLRPFKCDEQGKGVVPIVKKFTRKKTK